jgi:hypothetical protein
MEGREPSIHAEAFPRFGLAFAGQPRGSRTLPIELALLMPT